MNKLVKKIEHIITCNILGGINECTEESYIVGEDRTARLISEEAKKLAIEFAKELMKSKVKIAREGIIGGAKVVYSITPSEYTLMQGELEKNGNELFNKFIDKYYE